MAKNLWKFEPREKQSAETSGSPEAAEPSSQPQSVGTSLRERREERGEDLRYVAQMLRIRYPYLKAIEDGLIDDLPGPTYAIGFVRTYAEHLGLDAKETVVRFKVEVEGLNARNNLNFPAPIPEGKIPSGAILLVGIIVAALIYAVWIYVSSKDSADPVAATQSSGSVASVSGQAPVAAEAPAAESRTTPQTASGADVAAETTEPAPPAAKPAAPESATPAANTPAGASGEPEEKTDITAAPAGESANSEAPPTATKTETAVPPPAPPARETAAVEASPVAPAASAAGEAEAAPSEGGKVYGQDNTSARIVIHAIADSWVEVRDKTTDELLLTRVLFKGDSFRVPNRTGLSLLTGNAGGLRITVDGAAVPPIGSVGSVRRDVTLEPDQLKSGKRRVGNPSQSATTGTSPTAVQ